MSIASKNRLCPPNRQPDTPVDWIRGTLISLQADSSAAYLNLGLLEAQQGQRSAAGADLRKAIQLEPTLRARIPTSVLPDLSAAPPPTGSRSSQVPTSSSSP